jgi:hypothetical protein
MIARTLDNWIFLFNDGQMTEEHFIKHLDQFGLNESETAAVVRKVTQAEKEAPEPLLHATIKQARSDALKQLRKNIDATFHTYSRWFDKGTWHMMSDNVTEAADVLLSKAGVAYSTNGSQLTAALHHFNVLDAIWKEASK